MKKPKQFIFNGFFKSSSMTDTKWGFYRVKIGQGLGYSFHLIGSLDARQQGMGVLDINERIVDIVKTYDFKAASELLETSEHMVVPCNIEVFKSWLIKKEDQYWEDCEGMEAALSDFFAESKIDRVLPELPEAGALRYRFPHYGEDIVIPKGTTLYLPTDYRSDGELWASIIGEGKFYQKLKIAEWLRRRNIRDNHPEPSRLDVINPSTIQAMGKALEAQFGVNKLPWVLENDLTLRVRTIHYTKGNQKPNVIIFKIRNYGGQPFYRSRDLIVLAEDFETVEFYMD